MGGHAYGNRGPRGHDRRYGKAYSMHGDYNDQFDAENWRSSKSFDDNTYSFQFDPEDLVPVNGRGSAYSMHGHPRSSHYSSSDSKDSSEWSKSSSDSALSDDYKPIPPRPSGHAYAQRLTYHSSKQWKSPSKSDSASSVWNDDDSDDYEANGHAYTKRSIPKQTYGNAYSMHKDKEPKANWKKPSRNYEPKKSQWAKHDEPSYPPKDSKDSRAWKRQSKHSRDWKKDGDDYGRAYSLKGDYDVHHNAHGWRKPTYGSAYYTARRSVDYDSKKPQWAKDDYEAKHDEKEHPSKDEPKHEPKDDDYPSKDEPKHEPSKYDEPKKEDDGNYGTVYRLFQCLMMHMC